MRIDALLIQPEIEQLVLVGSGGATALLRSFATHPRPTTIDLPGGGKAKVWLLDPTGRTVATATQTGPTINLTVPAGGTAIVRRD